MTRKEINSEESQISCKDFVTNNVETVVGDIIPAGDLLLLRHDHFIQVHSKRMGRGYLDTIVGYKPVLRKFRS